jgi:hypothetical protein
VGKIGKAVGLGVGISDGIELGDGLGMLDGEELGSLVVGEYVGVGEGISEGLVLGFRNVGVTLGLEVGMEDGD